jgi:hypothetical protein
MSDLLALVFLLIGLGFAIAATVAAVSAVRGGEGVWKTFKTWVLSLIDAISGAG